MGKQQNTSIYYEAADIYLDSFPFASLTSLLEAGSYGSPLITFFPYSDTAGVLGADDLALRDCMVRATTLDQYRARIAELVESSAKREGLGQLTRECVTDCHCGSGWLRHLDHLYAQTLNSRALPEIPTDIHFGLAGEFDELLVRLQQVSGLSRGIHSIYGTHLNLLPLDLKLEKWRGSKGLRKLFLARGLASQWLSPRLRHGLRTLVHR